MMHKGEQKRCKTKDIAKYMVHSTITFLTVANTVRNLHVEWVWLGNRLWMKRGPRSNVLASFVPGGHSKPRSAFNHIGIFYKALYTA